MPILVRAIHAITASEIAEAPRDEQAVAELPCLVVEKPYAVVQYGHGFACGMPRDPDLDAQLDAALTETEYDSAEQLEPELREIEGAD